MKKIFGLVLALVMLVSVFAVLPAFAEDNAEEKNGWNVLLNDGIVLNYYDGDEKIGSVSVPAKELAVSQTIGEKTISVEAYLNGLITGEYGENTKALAQALLNYGAAAYDYFAAQGKCDDIPAIEGGEPVDAAILDEAVEPEMSVTDEDQIYLGASLVLDGTMKLRFYFKGNDLLADFQDTPNQTAFNKDGYCYFDATILPYEISKPVTIVVGNTTVTYAPLNYLKAMADNEELSEIVASIYAYGVAAEEYYVTDGCEHKGKKVIEVLTQATMYNDGKENEVCTICNKVIKTNEIDKTVPEVIVPETDEEFCFDYKVSAIPFTEDGKLKTDTLLIEYSVLFNETLENSAGASWLLTPYFTNDKLHNRDNWVESVYLHTNNKDCCTTGAFDINLSGEAAYGNSKVTYHENDVVVVREYNGKNYYVINDLYGWHRIGYKFTQKSSINNGAVSTKMYMEIWVDGVKALTVDVTKQFNSRNYFYKAEIGEDGELVYREYLDRDRFVTVLTFYNYGTTIGDFYLPVADVHVTAGDDFVLEASAVTSNPAVSDFTQGDLTIEGVKQHFSLNSVDYCAMGNHAWATEATVVVAATCTTNGQKAVKCTVCNAIDPDSVEVIESAGQHVWTDGDTITVPTVYSEGLKNVVCSACGEEDTETINNLPASAEEIFTTSGSGKTVQKYVKYSAALGEGEHFYPTEDNPAGQSLYVEFSFLWNETLYNKVNTKTDGAYALFGRLEGSSGGSCTPSWLLLTDAPNEKTWATVSGQFEFGGENRGRIEGALMGGETGASYPLIGDYGWHRIGLVYTQLTEARDDGANMIISLYVDGAHISTYYFSCSAKCLLYTDNGNGTYTDNLEAKINYFIFRDNVNTSDGEAYFVIADESISTGGFVMNVKPLTTPVDGGKYTTEDGEKLDADRYFKIGESGVCENGDHSFAVVPTVDFYPTCTTDGSKSIKCVVCGEINPDSVEVIPGGHKWATEATVDVAATCTTDGSKSIKCVVCTEIKEGTVETIASAGQHDLTNETIVTQPTVFSKGLKTAVCSICDEVVSETINETPATVITMTTSGGSEIRDYEDFDDILGDDSFCPTEENPDGNSLYVEFSFLWNETLANVTTNEAYAHLGRINSPDENGAFAPFWFALGDNCNQLWNQVAGGFELGNNGDHIYGPHAGEANGVYPGIGDYGWHRIGMEYTQLTEERADGSNMIVSLYIDGKLISTYYYICDEQCLLYTDKGDGTYTDNVNAKVLYHRIANPKTTGENAYFIVGDMSATVGDGFVKKVTKLDTPINGSYTTEDGTVIDADQHFAYVD